MDRSLTLPELVKALRGAEVFRNKCRIRPMAETFAALASACGIPNGDDAAAIPDGDGYLLLAAEGITADLVRQNPYLAGRCAVLANVNDIYAMGGRPLAMVDVIGTPDEASARELCRGMRDNAARYGVPVVGGHLLRTSRDSSVALAILGRAKACITSFDARPGDLLVLVTREHGQWLADMGFWNATLPEDDASLVPHLELLPRCAEAGLALAGKDVSMAGIAGTAIMLAEASHVGCRLDLDRIAPPAGVPLIPWLLAFQSYGFLLAVSPGRLEAVRALFAVPGLATAAIGAFCRERRIVLRRDAEEAVLWDLAAQPFAGVAR
ncbi:MAG: sll0787 family AIR synthase-like protein [Solidesulfovibrio sp. DCME]|uniref:sll0787 family AIR synthase-like protein n=1 Tax=Solidesulfovibrio sp. DCME TaxID=3447380 RepID=UPI003D0ED5C0